MTPTKARWAADFVRPVLDELLGLLGPFCERLEVAGSMRRQRPDVGDLELVAVPRMEPTRDLFGQAVPGRDRDLLGEYLALMVAQHVLAIRPRSDGARGANGPRAKYLLYRGIPVDLFVCLPPAQWGYIFAVRTGPAAFSKLLVTQRSARGLCPDGLHFADGALRDAIGQVIPTPEEADLFAALGIRYVEPSKRDAAAEHLKRAPSLRERLYLDRRAAPESGRECLVLPGGFPPQGER